MANLSLKTANRIKIKKSKMLKDKIISKKTAKKVPIQVKGKRKRAERGAVYIGHIPHGFYEDQMREFFRQFGKVTRVRLARSRKTGKSKGYAFVEFLNCEVAKIAAETMNNYLMFNKILKATYIPPADQRESMFISKITTDSFPKRKHQLEKIKNKNQTSNQKREEAIYNKCQRKIEDFKRFLQERGIEFNFKVNDPKKKKEIRDDVSESSIGDLYRDTTDSNLTTHSNLSNDSLAVLEIDESDDELQFHLPANVKKVLKRSSAKSKRIEVGQPKVKKLKQQNGIEEKWEKKGNVKVSKQKKVAKLQAKKKEKQEKLKKVVAAKRLGVKNVQKKLKKTETKKKIKKIK